MLTATYKCSSSFTNTNFMTKKNQKNKTKTLKDESWDVSRPRFKSREPQLWISLIIWVEKDIINRSGQVRSGRVGSHSDVLWPLRWRRRCCAPRDGVTAACGGPEPDWIDSSSASNACTFHMNIHNHQHPLVCGWGSQQSRRSQIW